MLPFKGASHDQKQQACDHYELIYSAKVEDFIPLVKYKSKRSGLTVCIGDVGGPTVNGYMCLATEVHDDDGLPHTLEHLIFLGSEDYPYKGVLDLVANRCLASGTNAFTATDHTCYTVTTAGSEGFLNFLPIYLDHILYPTLSDTGFTTEVHHINGDGEDAGVVYCEMQGVENNGETLVNNAMLREMYPGHCGYKCETGGILKNLRESTNNEKVRQYHRDFYRPENLCIIITGQVAPEDVFLALDPVEKKILSKDPRGAFVRPWQQPVPSFESDVLKTIPYPCDDELNGMVLVSWRGPSSDDTYNLIALEILLLYLTDTSVAPLLRDFVEIEDPFCGRVNYNIEIFLEGYIELMFENVPKAKLSEIKPRLEKVLQGISSGTEELNMERMENVIQRRILTILSMLESDPHELIAHQMIRDFLYGTGTKSLETQLCHVQHLKEMKKLDATFWLKLLREFFLERKSATIIGEPNFELMTKMADDEKDRVEKQRESLEKSGLELKAAELEKAMETNDIPPPDEMISSVVVPDIGRVKFHSICRSSNHSELAPNQNELFPLDCVPVRFQLDDIQSNFVSVHALLDTSKIPQHLKLYLPLLLELSLESPITRDGVFIPHDVVIKELSKDTVSSAFTLGITCHEMRFACAESAQMAHLFLQVEQEKYLEAVRWARELLFFVEFTAERIKIVANKMIQDVSTKKREGYFVAKSLVNELCFSKESNRHVNNLMRQNCFLTSLLMNLERAPEEVIAALKSTRAKLADLENITIHVATSVSKLFKLHGDPSAPWQQFYMRPKEEIGKLNVQKCSQLLQPFDSGLTHAIAGVGSVESSFLVQYAPCNLSHTHHDVPVLLVLLQYLTQLEGPMWKQIRGAGLAYGCNVNLDLEKGILYLFLYRSTHVIAAYQETISILENHISGKEEWEQSLIESARSSLMFELVTKEETVKSISLQSLNSHLNVLDADYNKTLLQNVAKVTVDDIKRIAPLYVPILFDPTKNWMAICCNPSKVDDIVSGFKGLSRDVAVTPLECDFMNALDL